MLFKDDPAWSDVTPVPQNEGPYNVCRVSYSSDFVDCYDMVRAVVKSGELSERVLNLTTEAIRHNASNYSVWELRRRVIKAINADLEKEIEFLNSVIIENPKCYQVWFHRGEILQLRGHADGELEWLEKEAHDEDAKNFHSWKYRQWVIRTFGLWARELDFVDTLLTQDCRNNSAWNQRHFVIANSPLLPGAGGDAQNHFDDPSVREREIDYTLEKLEVVPDNEAAWNYLDFLVRNKRLSKGYTRVKDLVDRLIVSQESGIRFALHFRLEYLIEHVTSGEEMEDVMSKIKAVCFELATKHDTVRRFYWKFRYDQLSNDSNDVLHLPNEE